MECLVVLGHELNLDNTVSDTFRNRLLKAAEWLYQHESGSCIITGGKLGHEISEAQLGKNYLCCNFQINSNRVMVEDKARNTVEKVKYVFEILKDMDCTSFSVLTSDWHAKRADVLFGIQSRLTPVAKYNGVITAFGGTYEEDPLFIASDVLKLLESQEFEQTEIRKQTINSYSKEPTLLVIAGAAASGKSTLGRRVASTKSWTYIDKGICTKELVDHIVGKETRESAKYKKIQPLEYKCTLKMAKENLDIGRSVVLVLPMIQQIDDYSKWQEMTKEYQFRNAKFVWMKHNEGEEYHRMKLRDADRDRWKLDNWEEYEKSIANLKVDERYDALKLDIYEPKWKLEEQVLKFLET